MRLQAQCSRQHLPWRHALLQLQRAAQERPKGWGLGLGAQLPVQPNGTSTNEQDPLLPCRQRGLQYGHVRICGHQGRHPSQLLQLRQHLRRCCPEPHHRGAWRLHPVHGDGAIWVSCRALIAGDRPRSRLPLCASTPQECSSAADKASAAAAAATECTAAPAWPRPTWRALWRCATPTAASPGLAPASPPPRSAPAWQDALFLFFEHAKPLFDQPRPTEQVTNMRVQCQLPCRSSRS